MGKRMQIFVLLCVLLTLFSGCGKTDSEGNTVENVRLSNVKTASMPLEKEEKAYMDAVEDVLKKSWAYRKEDNSIVFCANNTSQEVLDITVHISTFNKDGALTDYSSEELERWEPGQEVRLAFSTRSYEDTDTLTVVGEYANGSYWYMTDSIPLQLKAEEEGEKIILHYDSILPAVVRLEQSGQNSVSYTLLEYELEETEYTYGNYDLKLLLRKENGEDNNSDDVPVRIVDKKGAVHFSGIKYAEINQGETIRLTLSVFLPDPGEYYLELR